MKFTDWLIGGVSNSEDISIESAIKSYLGVIIRSLLPISILMLIFVTITSAHWLTPAGGWDKKFGLLMKLSLDGQTLANYVGIVLGTVVALAGSLVAIVLALRSQKTSEETVKLQKTANRLALGGRPEYQKAFEAAISYAAFKGFLVLLPMTMRRLQRNDKLSNGALSGLDEGNSYTQQLQSDLVKKLFDSILVSILPSLASRDKHGENSQRLIESQIAGVKDADHFMLGLYAGLQLMKSTDELIDSFDEKISERCDTYDEYPALKLQESARLTEVEFWFVRHVRPYTKINRNLSFGGDFHPWFKRAENNIISTYDLNIPIVFKKDFKDKLHSSGNAPILTASLSDSGLYEVQRKILLAEGDVEIKVIANNWERGLEAMVRKLTESPSKVVLIYDQIDIYFDDNNLKNKFNLSQQLRFWKMCRLAVKVNEIRRKPFGREVDLTDLRKELGKQEYSDLLSIRFKDDIDNVNNQFDKIFYSAASKISLDDPEDTKFEIIDFINDAAISDALPSGISISETLLSEIEADFLAAELSENAEQLIKELARIPLYERPMYGWFGRYGEEVPATLPAGLKIVANIYFNSELQVEKNLLTEWLLIAAEGQICWVD